MSIIELEQRADAWDSVSDALLYSNIYCSWVASVLAANFSMLALLKSEIDSATKSLK